MKKENMVQSCDFRFSFVILRDGRVGGPLVDLEEEDIELLLRVASCVRVCVRARERGVSRLIESRKRS